MGDEINGARRALSAQQPQASLVKKISRAEKLQIKVANWLYSFMVEMSKDSEVINELAKLGSYDTTRGYKFYPDVLLETHEEIESKIERIINKRLNKKLRKPDGDAARYLKSIMNVKYDVPAFTPSQLGRVTTARENIVYNLTTGIKQDLPQTWKSKIIRLTESIKIFVEYKKVNTYKRYLKKKSNRIAGKKIHAARNSNGGAKGVGRIAEEGGEGIFRRARRVLTEAEEFVTKNWRKAARIIFP